MLAIPPLATRYIKAQLALNQPRLGALLVGGPRNICHTAAALCEQQGLSWDRSSQRSGLTTTCSNRL